MVLILVLGLLAIIGVLVGAIFALSEHVAEQDGKHRIERYKLEEFNSRLKSELERERKNLAKKNQI